MFKLQKRKRNSKNPNESVFFFLESEDKISFAFFFFMNGSGSGTTLVDECWACIALGGEKASVCTSNSLSLVIALLMKRTPLPHGAWGGALAQGQVACPNRPAVACSSRLQLSSCFLCKSKLDPHWMWGVLILVEGYCSCWLLGSPPPPPPPPGPCLTSFFCRVPS